MDLVNADDNPRELLQKKYLEFGIATRDLPEQPTPDEESLARLASIWPTSYGYQLGVLMHRNAKNSKSKLFTVLNFVQSIVLALITGLCWFRLADTDTTVADRQGFVSFPFLNISTTFLFLPFLLILQSLFLQIFFVMTFWPFVSFSSASEKKINQHSKPTHKSPIFLIHFQQTLFSGILSCTQLRFFFLLLFAFADVPFQQFPRKELS